MLGKNIDYNNNFNYLYIVTRFIDVSFNKCEIIITVKTNDNIIGNRELVEVFKALVVLDTNIDGLIIRTIETDLKFKVFNIC